MNLNLMCGVTLALVANTSHRAAAFQEPATPSQKVEIIASGFDYPCAVTLHPEFRWPIVANSGAGNVVAVVDGQKHILIDGFEVIPMNQNPAGMFGPAGLTTINFGRDKNLLVVGTAGEDAGSDYVGAFPLNGDNAISLHKTIDADNELFGRTLNRFGDLPALGDFFCITSFDGFVWFTTRGDNSTSWIGEFQMTDGVAGKCRRFFKTATPDDETLSTAIAFGPDGLLAVACRRISQELQSAQLGFYEIENGRLRASFDLELEEIVAIAWSPVTGSMFILNNSNSDPEKSGLYTLVASDLNRQCRADFLVNITHPAGMCFRDDGCLWVTSFGNKPEMGAGTLLLVSHFESTDGAKNRSNE